MLSSEHVGGKKNRDGGGSGKLYRSG